MDRLISCEFNMDTACVELKFFDGSKIAIDTIAVENEVADNMYQRSELDYLIYNAAFRCVIIHHAGNQPPKQKKYRNCQQDRQNGEPILKEPEHTAQHFPRKRSRQ